MTTSSFPVKGASLLFERIPTYAKYQWLNSPQIVDTLNRFLRPSAKGRKGYDKTLMFRWLIYKWLMRCTYRDLESITGVDYSTFIKFRKRLIASFLFPRIFGALVVEIVACRDTLHLVLDSTFVETHSKHAEDGAEYFGYKKKTGFKLHQMIDYETRLPVLQFATPGARSDVVWGTHLIRAAPFFWNVRAVVADKAYDSEAFVQEIKAKWKKVKVGIPIRKTNQEKVAGRPEGWLNRLLKSLPRTLNRGLLNTRSEIERHFSRKKHVFHLGQERTRGLVNFEANCYMTSIMAILEWVAKTAEVIRALFTKLP